jgi:2-polyprenyl-3-methyl-5-hydroxy-6-metoxy-1,4-benzoquinol methylase
MGDRERWNARWREQAGELAPPAAFVVEHAALLPASGRALDVAGGAGRHAVWLARAGLDVIMIDVSDVALERAERRAAAANVAGRIRFRRIDLSEPGPDGELPTGPFDVIVMFHYLDRARRGELVGLLSPGGLLITCQPTVVNLERHAHPSRAYLLDEGELATWVSTQPLDVVVSREGWNVENRHEAELIARRR